MIATNLGSLPTHRKTLAEVRKARPSIDTLMSLTLIVYTAAGNAMTVAFIGIINNIADWMIELTEDRTRHELTDVFGAHRTHARILVDGAAIEVPLERLSASDIVVIQAGEVVPVDGTITVGAATVDQRVLFGEQDPVARGIGDSVYAGTALVGGSVHVAVTHAGADTLASGVTRLLERTADYRTTYERKHDGMMRRIVPAVIGSAALTWPLLGPSQAMSVLIYCPGEMHYYCLPFSTLRALRDAVAGGILVKDGRSLEILPRIDTVLFDKTGTLTLDVPDVGEIASTGELSPTDLIALAAAAEGRQTHPIARAIRERAHTDCGRDGHALAGECEDAAALYTVGLGASTRVGGRRVLVGNRRHLELMGLDPGETLHETLDRWAAGGSSVILVGIDDRVAGALEIRHRPRPGAAQCVAELKRRGIECQIVSGDSEAATAWIAEQVGIGTWHAGRLPDQKRELVADLTAAGRTVCFIGDGINDAVALKAAAAGVSIGGASQAATDVAGIVLLDADLRHLIRVLDIADGYERRNAASAGASYALPLAGIAAALALHTSPLFAILVQDAGFWVSFALANGRGRRSSALERSSQVEGRKPGVERGTQGPRAIATEV